MAGGQCVPICHTFLEKKIILNISLSLQYKSSYFPKFSTANLYVDPVFHSRYCCFRASLLQTQIHVTMAPLHPLSAHAEDDL